MAEYEALALIPARGGSKGIPEKNIRTLGGMPLIAYSIRAALAAKTIGRVIVSTESERVAEIARQYGADVPFLRPQSLAQDNSLLPDVIHHTIYRLREEQGYDPTHLVLLYPTHPFRTPALIDFLTHKLFQGYAEVIVVERTTCAPNELFEPDEGRLVPIPVCPQPRSFSARSGLYAGKSMVGKGPRYVHTIRSRIELVDIDHWRDFYLAESIVQNSLYDFYKGAP